MLSFVILVNEIKEYIDRLKNEREKYLKRIRIDANNAIHDFPALTLDQFNKIIQGWFQLKQAKNKQWNIYQKMAASLFSLQNSEKIS